MGLRFLNRARMSVSGTPGTGAITLNAALGGFQTLAAAGINDQDTVRYVIEDGTNWEVGLGTYTASGTSLARTTIIASSNSGSAISVTSAAIVYSSIDGDDLATAKEGWTNLTFGTTVTIFGSSGVYKSDQSFALSTGVIMDVEAFVHGASSAAAFIALSADATNGWLAQFTAAGNQSYDRYVSGSFNNVGNSAINTSFAATHYMRLRGTITSYPAWLGYAMVDNWQTSSNTGDSGILSGTNHVYLLTDNIAGCSVRARIGAGGMFTG